MVPGLHVMIDDDTAPQPVIPGPVFPQGKDYQHLKVYLTTTDLPIEVCVAQHEAEALVSYLVTTDKAQFAITDDSDALAFLSPQTVFHYGKDSASVVSLQDILQGLSMTPARFQTFCI